MPAPVKHPLLAMLGLGVIALLCVQLLRNSITLEAAATRAVLTLVVLALVDRVAVPIGQAMLAPPVRKAPPVAPARPGAASAETAGPEDRPEGGDVGRVR
ncbi:MAG: hypothetical protein ACKV2O_11795 [Acidimicrobiales bacterium]